MMGLRAKRVNKGGELVTQQDVADAPEEHRERLRQLVGKEICSIIPAGEMRRSAGEAGEPGFAPSVPFVACLSAAMVAGELVKHALGLPSPLQPRYQVDLLQGPASGLTLEQGRRSGCTCATRRANIDAIRQQSR